MYGLRSATIKRAHNGYIIEETGHGCDYCGNTCTRVYESLENALIGIVAIMTGNFVNVTIGRGDCNEEDGNHDAGKEWHYRD